MTHSEDNSKVEFDALLRQTPMMTAFDVFFTMFSVRANERGTHLLIACQLISYINRTAWHLQLL